VSNQYGWSPPTGGQPPVYFAPPGQSVPAARPGTYYAVPGAQPYVAPDPAYYAAPRASYAAAPQQASYAAAPQQVPYYAPPEAAYYAAPEVPYDNGYDAYRTYREKHAPQPTRDPYAGLPRSSNPFMSLSARGARQKVTMVEALILWLRNWNNFTGRASRSEYAWIRAVQLVGQILWWVLLVLMLQTRDLAPTDLTNLAVSIALLVTSLVALVLFIPTLSLTVRRLHDTDHSGWYVFMRYVPFGSWMLTRALYQSSVDSGFRFDDYTKPPFGVEDID
jgi:uncharacterized membrane protein YhaH (DUF805 family)